MDIIGNVVLAASQRQIARGSARGANAAGTIWIVGLFAVSHRWDRAGESAARPIITVTGIGVRVIHVLRPRDIGGLNFTNAILVGRYVKIGVAGVAGRI